MIEVVNKVEVREVDGEEVKIGEDAPTIEVLSHSGDDDLVVIRIGEHTYAVFRDDLELAIQNATNTSM